MIRRSARVLAAACAGWLVVACLDVASPVKGISAISPVLLPTPSVVVNDTMRDIAGNVTPLHVLVYGPNGDTLPHDQFKVSFVAIDTSGNLIVNDTGLAYAKDDSLSPTAQVVAQVTMSNGGGTIQALAVPLPVVPVPAAANRDSGFTFQPPFSAADTLSSTLISPPLTVRVFSGTSTAVPSYPVIFTIVQQPNRFSYNGPLVVLTNSAGRDTTVGITGTSGQAQVFLRFRPSAATNEQLSALFSKPDTVVVRAQVRYRKGQVAVTPSDSFVILIQPGAAKIQ